MDEGGSTVASEHPNTGLREPEARRRCHAQYGASGRSTWPQHVNDARKSARRVYALAMMIADEEKCLGTRADIRWVLNYSCPKVVTSHEHRSISDTP